MTLPRSSLSGLFRICDLSHLCIVGECSSWAGCIIPGSCHQASASFQLGTHIGALEFNTLRICVSHTWRLPWEPSLCWNLIFNPWWVSFTSAGGSGVYCYPKDVWAFVSAACPCKARDSWPKSLRLLCPASEPLWLEGISSGGTAGATWWRRNTVCPPTPSSFSVTAHVLASTSEQIELWGVLLLRWST